MTTKTEAKKLVGLLHDEVPEEDIELLKNNGYKLDGYLDSGQNSDIFTGSDRNGKPCAIKRIRNRGQWTDALYREVQTHIDLQHPSLVQTYKTIKSKRFTYVVMEKILGCTLKIYLEKFSKDKKIDEYTALRIIQDLISGVQYLHNQGLVHGDLHGANVMIAVQNNQMVCKLLDFGNTQAMSQDNRRTDIICLAFHLSEIVDKTCFLRNDIESKLKELIKNIEDEIFVDINQISNYMSTNLPINQNRPPRLSYWKRFLNFLANKIGLGLRDEESSKVLESSKAMNSPSDVIPIPEEDRNTLEGFGFLVGAQVGSGLFGDVFNGVCDQNAFAYVYESDQEQVIRTSLQGKPCVIKRLPRTARWTDELISEVETYIYLDHPNIGKIYRVCECPQYLYIVMEFLNVGTLKKFIERLGRIDRIDEYTALCIIRDLTAGLRYLHSHKIVHGDLHDRNVMIAIQNNVMVFKIVDFGIAKAMGQVSPLNDIAILARLLINVLDKSYFESWLNRFFIKTRLEMAIEGRLDMGQVVRSLSRYFGPCNNPPPSDSLFARYCMLYSFGGFPGIHWSL